MYLSCGAKKFLLHILKWRLFNRFSHSTTMNINNLSDEYSAIVRKINLSNQHSDNYKECVKEAKYVLEVGGAIGIPTDTIYGVAALAQNTKGVEKLYYMKCRSSSKPIAVSLGDIEDISRWGRVTIPGELLEDLLPGPVTLVFERTARLNPALNPNSNLVGIRIPDYQFVRDVARACVGPVALTSANISHEPSTIAAQEFRHLWPQLDLVFCDDLVTDPSRLGSSVIDLSREGHYTIIRSGRSLESIRCKLQMYGLKETVDSDR